MQRRAFLTHKLGYSRRKNLIERKGREEKLAYHSSDIVLFDKLWHFVFGIPFRAIENKLRKWQTKEIKPAGQGSTIWIYPLNTWKGMFSPLKVDSTSINLARVSITNGKRPSLTTWYAASTPQKCICAQPQQQWMQSETEATTVKKGQEIEEEEQERRREVERMTR